VGSRAGLDAVILVTLIPAVTPSSLNAESCSLFISLRYGNCSEFTVSSFFTQIQYVLYFLLCILSDVRREHCLKICLRRLFAKQRPIESSLFARGCRILREWRNPWNAFPFLPLTPHSNLYFDALYTVITFKSLFSRHFSYLRQIPRIL
jgi:hypothetical protein